MPVQYDLVLRGLHKYCPACIADQDCLTSAAHNSVRRVVTNINVQQWWHSYITPERTCSKAIFIKYLDPECLAADNSSTVIPLPSLSKAGCNTVNNPGSVGYIPQQTRFNALPVASQARPATTFPPTPGSVMLPLKGLMTPVQQGIVCKCSNHAIALRNSCCTFCTKKCLHSYSDSATQWFSSTAYNKQYRRVPLRDCGLTWAADAF